VAHSGPEDLGRARSRPPRRTSLRPRLRASRVAPPSLRDRANIAHATRWHDEHAQAYALGDNALIAVHADATVTVLTDRRLQHVGAEQLQQYRQRLAHGHPYDDDHPALLRQIVLAAPASRPPNRSTLTARAGPGPSRRTTRHLPSCDSRSPLREALLCGVGCSVSRRPGSRTAPPGMRPWGAGPGAPTGGKRSEGAAAPGRRDPEGTASMRKLRPVLAAPTALGVDVTVLVLAAHPVMSAQ
jgi:hypothetical protein